MQRTIKFRGKRIDNGEWVHGCYLKRWAGTTYKHCINAGIMEYEVDPATVGQYTGLHDKNDKEICEGDIVKYSDTIHEVVFEQRNNTAYFGLVYSPVETLPFGHYQDLRQIEVIGSAFENHELLEVKP